MLNLTIHEEFDFHDAYHGEMLADWCKFCVPFHLRDHLVVGIESPLSLQRGERLGDVESCGAAFPVAELRASGATTGGPQ